jgi:hypothetical protein
VDVAVVIAGCDVVRRAHLLGEAAELGGVLEGLVVEIEAEPALALARGTPATSTRGRAQ